MKTLYLNCERSPLTKAVYLMRAAERDPIPGWEVAELSKENQDAEYVLNIEPYNGLRVGSKWTGLWEIDLLCDRPQLSLSDWFAVDDVFVAITEFPDHMRTKDKVPIFLPQAVDIEWHKYNPKIQKKYDFIIAGSMGLGIYSKRQEVFNKLKENFTYNGLGKVELARYIEAQQEGRVQVIRSMSTPIGDGECAQRFFELMAIGPVLTNMCMDLLVMSDLEEGEDYLTYETPDEAVEKMEYLLLNPEEADRIAANGRKKILANHKYEDRLRTIIDHAEQTNR